MRHVVVLAALFTARLTCIGTHRTQCFGTRTVTRHQGRRQRAQLRAVDVQGNALGHHLHIRLC